MKKSIPQMIPRSVNSKRKAETKQQVGKQQDEISEDSRSRRTDNASSIKKAVTDLLTDMVQNSSKTEDVKLKTLDMNAAQKSVSDAIQLQQNAPYVNVGAVSYSKRVPVYHRRRNTNQNWNETGHKVYTGLTWEPEVLNFHHQGSRWNQMRNERNEYYPRQWEYTRQGQRYMHHSTNQTGFTFTVMSYNVLAQNLLDDNYRLYFKSPNMVLDWNYRKKQLMRELIYHRPDVICLQEVNCDHYGEFFLPELKKQGYDGVYMKRTGDKQDGCATFYKKHKFTCIEVVKVPYSERNGGDLLKRDNVGLLVKLHRKRMPSNRSLTIANTHLLFNPRRGDIKIAQLMVLLAELDKCAYSGDIHDKYQAVIMCGDFNSEPHSDIYKLIIMGYLKYEGLLIREMSGQQEGRNGHGTSTLDKRFFSEEAGITDDCQYCDVISHRVQPGTSGADDDIQIIGPQGSGVLRHDLHFISVYEHWLSRLNYRSKEMTTYHGKAACSVDYLFYGVRSGLARFYDGEVQTKDVVEGHLSLLGRYGLLSGHELKSMGSLPNYQYGSDHLSVIAWFMLT